MKPPSVDFSVGDTFVMKVPMPEDMHEEHGESFVVEATYKGTMSDTEVEAMKASGSIKEIYNCLNFSEHHVVSFGDTDWVNDFINPAEDFIPTPIV